MDRVDTPTEIKFFEEHRSNTSEENKLIEFVKKRNKEINFVPKTVQLIGYPRWDKVIKQKIKIAAQQKIPSTESTAQKSYSVDNNATIYYIPFVRDSQNHVNAAMVLKTTTTDTSLSYLCDWEYRKLQKNNAGEKKPEQFALFFMQLDKNVFGHTKFKVLDPTLFKQNNKGGYQVELTNGISSKKIPANLLVEVEHCQSFEITWVDCPWRNRGEACPGGINGACDGCPEYCRKGVDITFCWSEWQGIVGGWNTGSNPDPGTPPGDGGTSGGYGSTPPAPCDGEGGNNPNGSNISDRTPCSPDPGWEPVENSQNPQGLPDDNSVFFDAPVEANKIDINKMMKCFDNIPNNGATYSVKVCVDIPNNADPSELWSLSNRAGHAFITMTKSNGSQSVSQSFGFYPNVTIKAISFSPVSSTIVNDGTAGGEHAYNASITMPDITSSNFETIISAARTRSTLNYDLNNNNCAHFAIGVFNSIRNSYVNSVPINQNIYIPPASYAPIYFGESPAGLYQKLAAMKNSNNSEAANIEIGVVKSATTSNGPCN